MSSSPHIILRLLDSFEVEKDGIAVPLTFSGQAVVSYLALRGPADRYRIASTLWPDVERTQAGARLRTAIWRVQKSCVGLLKTTAGRIGLAEIKVDIDQLLNGAHRRVVQVPPRAQLWGELLPGWYDDWVIVERERFRERRLRALETLAARLLLDKQYAASLEVAMACIAAEPLREAGHEIVARVHLAERNYSEVVRHIESYQRLLRAEIEGEPSAQFSQMLEYARVPRPLLLRK